MLTTDYRPQTFESLVGQSHIGRILKGILDSDHARTFLLTGPSGCGKTTTARIIANYVDCDPANIIEIDAASNSGVEQMRKLVQSASYRALGNGKRMIVIDECHALSKSAWQTMLKALEETNPGTYWCLCTTESGKVPRTIQTRAVKCEVKLVTLTELIKLLKSICSDANIDVPLEVLECCADAADGSPRQALTNLASCATCESKYEAQEVLEKEVESKAAYDLCRAIASKSGYKHCAAIVSAMPTDTFQWQSVRATVLAYFTKVAMNDKGDPKYALSVLSAFSESSYLANPKDKWPILLALGVHFYDC